MAQASSSKSSSKERRTIRGSICAAVLAGVLLCAAASAQDWAAQFKDAEAAFNGRTQSDCIPLFLDLTAHIDAERKNRMLTEEERSLLSRSYDSLAQAYFNLNEQEKARDALMKILQVDPGYHMDEQLTSTKIIGVFNLLKQSNLGSISLSTTPQGATVRMDGYPLDTAGGQEIRVFKGTHRLEASKPGYITQANSVNVEAGKSIEVALDLKPEQHTVAPLQEVPPGSRAESKMKLAAASESSGDYKAAQEYCEQALALYREAGDRAREAQTLTRLGYNLLRQNRDEEAGTRFQEAAAIYQALGDPRGIKRAQQDLKLPGLQAGARVAALIQSGFEAMNANDYEMAVVAYQLGFEIAHDLGDVTNQSNALNSLGFVLSRQGNDAGAKERWLQARSIARNGGDKRAEAVAVFNLSTAEYNLGNYPGADKLYEESAALFREIGDQPIPKPWK